MDALGELRAFVRKTLIENKMMLVPAERWEIHDDKGMLLKGEEDEMLYAWNINYLNDKAFKEIYGTTYRNPKYIIKEWYGSLRLINIVSERRVMPDEHKWEDNDWATTKEDYTSI